jgi:HK97 family phage prohead protease
VDSWGDRIAPGAFAKTISENIKSVRHLWNHNYSEPPIAKIVELRELSKDELPAEVLAKAPDATGGLLVAREYFTTARAEEILQGIDGEAINEMSFAYDVVKFEETVEQSGSDDMPKRSIRELKELKLFDTSDVNWGMNGATVAVGAKNLNSLPLGAIVSHLQFHQSEVKAGSRNSAADAALIETIHGIVVDLGAKCETGDDEKINLPEPEAKSEQAEAVITDTSLSELKQRFNRLQIEKLKI